MHPETNARCGRHLISVRVSLSPRCWPLRSPVSGQELRWDVKNYRFTNHEQANKTILKRDYNAGFEPV